MSIYRFTVYLGKLYNIGLYRKGYYTVSLRAYRSDELNLRTPAISSTVGRNTLRMVKYQCSTGHYVCNWKCYSPEPLESRYLTDSCFFEYQQDIVNIDKQQLFQIDIDNLNDVIWIEFELFYSPAPGFEINGATSCKRVYLGLTPSSEFKNGIYHSILFKDIDCCSLDVVISGIAYNEQKQTNTVVTSNHQHASNIFLILVEVLQYSTEHGTGEILMLLIQLQKLVSFPLPTFSDLNSLPSLLAPIFAGDIEFIEYDEIKIQEDLSEITKNLFQMYAAIIDFGPSLDDKRQAYQVTVMKNDMQQVLFQMPFNSKKPNPSLPQQSYLTILKDMEDSVIIERVESSVYQQEVIIDNVISTITSPGADGIHLIVFVHGFNGCRNDFKLYSNQLTLLAHNLQLNTEYQYLFSSSTENQSNKSLSTLGKLLAEEIKVFINNSPFPYTQISFVCHSMGGLVARCSLKELDRYSRLFATFTTFGTPHLSSFYLNNPIASPVFNVYQIAMDSKSLAQIKMADHLDKRQTLLYHLSYDSRLKHFKAVNLFASKQDRYVQFETCTLTNLKNNEGFNSEDKAIFLEMKRNLTSNCQNLRRYQIQFIPNLQESPILNVDLLGRQAHLSMLKNTSVARLAVTLNTIHN